MSDSTKRQLMVCQRTDQTKPMSWSRSISFGSMIASNFSSSATRRVIETSMRLWCSPTWKGFPSETLRVMNRPGRTEWVLSVLGLVGSGACQAPANCRGSAVGSASGAGPHSRMGLHCMTGGAVNVRGALHQGRRRQSLDTKCGEKQLI